MKAHVNKQPRMITYLELNQRYGYGYQARMEMEGVLHSTLDAEPFTLDEAVAGTAQAIEEINRQCGYSYRPESVIRISPEAVEANKTREFTSARFARDIAEGRNELCREDKADVAKKVIDGKEEICLSGRGTVLMTYFSWLNDKLPKAKRAMQRYCEYIAMHGGGTASGLFEQLEAMSKDAGAEWMKDTYARFVMDDTAVINYILER